VDPKDFDDVLEEYHRALGALINRDPEVYKSVFSHADDVTLANPFAPLGPVSRGWRQVAESIDLGSKNYEGGELIGFESFARYVGSDFAYIVELERFQAKVVGLDEPRSLALRVTSVFRVEGGEWKVVHRQADPIVTARPAASVAGG
jgi:ketosteroid isomerase-like protein